LDKTLPLNQTKRKKGFAGDISIIVNISANVSAILTVFPEEVETVKI
jgi:hypothetical protein